MRVGWIIAIVSLFFPQIAAAQQSPLIPERRMIITENADLPGNDIAQIFDVTVDACIEACLKNDACAAFTFNARSNACFPKSISGAPVAYQGAYSGLVLPAPAGAEERARAWVDQAGDLLRPADLSSAHDMARDLAKKHLVGNFVTADLVRMARAAEIAGDLTDARRMIGAATNLLDTSSDWSEYARLWLAGNKRHNSNPGTARTAALNAYLRAGDAWQAATALQLMARADLADKNGRRAIKTLRLAMQMAPSDELATILADAEGKYGFRITGQDVDADPANPQICAVFSDLLDEAVDYTPFVALPSGDLTVEASGTRLCIGRLAHGQRYTLTFREGLPSASGDTTSHDVEVAHYIRDRHPQVRFEGRSYVLPRMADAGLPVITVNTQILDLKLIRISDRNLVRTLRDNYLARPMDYWSEEYFTSQIGKVVWQGQASVNEEQNRDVTTRLPIQEVTGPLGTGIYALQASIPDTSPEEIAPATQWFTISDIGITSLSGIDGLHVIVRGLSDAAARPGAEVQLLSRGNDVLAQARTDADGVVAFDAGLTRGTGNAAPMAITVMDGDDLSFLPLNDTEFDLSDRGVEGLPPAPSIDVFLTTDRGAYRAGETVHATILARNGADQRALTGLPLTAVLSRPDGVEFMRHLAPEAGAGGHTAAFNIPETAPRGTWRLDILADPNAPALASQKVLVEDFLPERIDMVPIMPEGTLAPTDTPSIEIDVRYLFGAPAGGLDVTGEVRLTAVRRLVKHEGFVFGREDVPFNSQIEYFGPGKTDDQGHLSLTATLPDPGADGARPMKADFILSVSEGSGRPVERRIERTVLPGMPVAGLRPLFEGDAITQGGDAGFAVIMLAPDGTRMTGTVDWIVNRVETDYQWYSLNGRWDYEPVTRRVPLARGSVDALADDQAEMQIPAMDWGRYEIIVVPAGAEGRHGAASLAFDVGWYAASGGTAPTPDRLPVSLDRPGYRAGDTAIARIEAPRDGAALVSVLTNRVVDLKLVELTEGENSVELPVTDAWGSGAYVMASAIRPVGEDAGHAPVRALGLAHAAIEPGDRALNAVIEAPEATDPRGALPVTLRVDGAQPGDQVFATLAAVDLGILNLTGFEAPDPSAHYFGQRRLGVGIRDIYGRLIDGQAGTPGAIRSGGDAVSTSSLQAPPPTEDLMAWFSGPLTVAGDGTITTEIPLPAFNGTVRLMAVVWSGRAVGQATRDVLVRDPVVLAASAPRFMAPGDTAQVLLELTHASGPAGDIRIEAQAEGVSIATPPPATVALAELSTARLTLPITAPETVGPARIALAVTTPDGRRLEQVVHIPIRANGPEVSRESRFVLGAGNRLTLPPDLMDGMRPGSGTATLAIGPAARFNSAAIMRSLQQYPYGCTEQLTSKALPLLAFSNMMEGLPEASTAAERIDQHIAKILTRQDANGAFGLWRPQSGDPWLDAYVTDFLSRARASGHTVPDAAFGSALDNLRNQVNYAADFDERSNGGGEALAYALMVLARENAAAVGDLRYYADTKAGDFGSPLAVAQLGMALALIGDQTRADNLFARATNMLQSPGPDNDYLRVDFGTNLRDRAGVLSLAVAAGSGIAGLDQIGQSLENSLIGQPLSPQEAVWSLMAAGALTPDLALPGLSLNGQQITGPLIRDVTANGANAILLNDSGRETRVTLTLRGVPLVPEPAGGKGYSISRDYYTPDGEAVDPTSVVQGQRLVVVVTVNPHGKDSVGRLMVDDPLPAGVEIENPHLLKSGETDGLDWLNVESNVDNSEFLTDRFLTAITWTSGDTLRLAYRVRAITPGSFNHPAASVINMYRPEYRAWTESGHMTITGGR
ncbi:MAG: alpha-2-macroglobulin family protein [Pseudorhodobacter sp.]